MEVWRSQDASPLHGVDETRLRLALRQEQTKLHARRRRMRWVAYLTSAFVIGLMTLFLLMMISGSDSGIDWAAAIPVAGAAGALLFGGAIHVRYRAQTQLEQGFGESLRDQVNRQIALIDPFMTNPWATGTGRAIFMLSLVLVAAIGFMSGRVNEHKPFDEAWRSAVATIFIGLIGGWVAGLWLRRWNRRIGAPRKRRLEALLKEFDG